MLFSFVENENVQTILLDKKEEIAAAFQIPKGITALVGGGGKTTLMLRLGRALSQRGAKVILTTTTHIFPPEEIYLCNPASEADACEALKNNNLVCFGVPAEDGKLSAPSLPIDSMETLAEYVLVESDGAKRLPLKAPAEHEPVIPNRARLVIAVAGLDGIGKTIRETAFRSPLYAALLGKTEDDIVTAADIAEVLLHPNGQRKSLPDGARFAVLLNKADDQKLQSAALEIASALRGDGAERVIIAALGRE